MKKRELKKNSSSFIKRLLNKDLRIFVIQAGFPYHKSPHLYQWLWVFILLPFLPEDTLNELSDNHGKELRCLYQIIEKYPHSFEKLVCLLAIPLFFELLEEFNNSSETKQSRNRIQLIVDDTKSEKFGHCMEFIHKLFDCGKKQYVMGYNYVFVIVVSGNFIFPLHVGLWLPKPHPKHRSKNDMFSDFIADLESLVADRNQTLSDVEITFDSAYCVQKVMKAVGQTELRCVTKPDNNHKFEFNGQKLTPNELIEMVKDGHWKYLAKGQIYQRLSVTHHRYGEVVLLVRRKKLKNGKIIHDVLLCNRSFYTAQQINTCYLKRWNIEVQFKYYKQHLNLGKTQFRKFGAIQSALFCVAFAGILVALYCRQLPRFITFGKAVKQIMSFFASNTVYQE